jgi:hypothetical protein
MVIVVHAPEEGEEQDNELLYSRVQEITDKVQTPDYFVIMGDLNVRVDNKKIQSDIGTHDEETFNSNSKRLIDYAL